MTAIYGWRDSQMFMKTSSYVCLVFVFMKQRIVGLVIERNLPDDEITDNRRFRCIENSRNHIEFLLPAPFIMFLSLVRYFFSARRWFPSTGYDPSSKRCLSRKKDSDREYWRHGSFSAHKTVELVFGFAGRRKICRTELSSLPVTRDAISCQSQTTKDH